MKVLFQLGHPAHFHLFRNTIADLQRDGHQIFILIRKKDILEDLLKQSGLPYVNILPSGKKSSFTLMLRLWRVFKFALCHRVDVLVGSTPEVAQVAWLLRRRSVVMAEDDATIVPQFIKAVKPFVDNYLSPVSCKCSMSCFSFRGVSSILNHAGCQAKPPGKHRDYNDYEE